MAYYRCDSNWRVKSQIEFTIAASGYADIGHAVNGSINMSLIKKAGFNKICLISGKASLNGTDMVMNTYYDVLDSMIIAISTGYTSGAAIHHASVSAKFICTK